MSGRVRQRLARTGYPVVRRQVNTHRAARAFWRQVGEHKKVVCWRSWRRRDRSVARPGRPRDPLSRNQQMKGTSQYQPTKADLEEDMRVDASFEELVDAMFGRRPRRVIH